MMRPAKPAKQPTETELSKTALQAFFNIVDRWRLRDEEARILLGNPSRTTFYTWKREKKGRLPKDAIERISYIMGIYKALKILLASDEAVNQWPKKPNSYFNNKSALDIMLGGNVVDLADVRRYLDAVRG